LIGSADKSIKIWNKTDWTLIESLEIHSGAVRCLVQLSEGKIASGSDDKTIKIWKLNDIINKNAEMKKTETLKGHSSPIRSLVYLEFNNHLASSEWDSLIFIWDLNDFSLKTQLKASSSFNSLVSLSNEYFISGTSNGFIQIWNTTSFTEIKSYFRDSAAILSFSLLTERQLVVGFANGKIEILNFVY